METVFFQVSPISNIGVQDEPQLLLPFHAAAPPQQYTTREGNAEYHLQIKRAGTETGLACSVPQLYNVSEETIRNTKYFIMYSMFFLI